MQKNIGSLLALYPTPATIVGAKVEGKGKLAFSRTCWNYRS